MSTGKHGTGGESRETSARKGRKVEDERKGRSRRQLGGRWLGEDEENEAERGGGGGGGWLSSWLDIAQ